MLINIIITILNISHRPVFCLEHGATEIGFCLSLQVESTQLGPVDRNSLCLRTPAATPIELVVSVSAFINPTGVRKQTSSVCWVRLSRFHLKRETGSNLRLVVFEIKDRAMDNVLNFGS
jgi:hypothetical protein